MNHRTNSSEVVVDAPMYVPNIESLMDFDIDELLNEPNSNFQLAPTLQYSLDINESNIQDYTITQGIPLVLTQTTATWDTNMFSIEYLQENYGSYKMVNSPRNNETHSDLDGWTLDQFINYLQVSQEERNPKYLYAKDISCPDEWCEYVHLKLAKNLVYHGSYDLMSNLPEYLRTESIMSYIGSNGTYTPAHLDLVGSKGHNIMVSSENNGYALWLMVARKDRAAAFQFWAERGGDIFNENRFINPKELCNAPFKIYVIKQRVGDMVLVPPEAVHQVMNIGGTTIKIAWNTVSAKSIAISYYSSLPLAKIYHKPEMYRIKAVVYNTLKRRFASLKELNDYDSRAIIEYTSPLLDIYSHMIQSESILIPKPSYPFCATGETIPFLQPFKPFITPFTHDRKCDHCNCDIFNRCYHCQTCGNRENNGKDYCFDCVSRGFGCEHHFQEMTLREFISHSKLKKELSHFYDEFTQLMIKAGTREKEAMDLVQSRREAIVQQCGFLTTATIAYHVVYFSTQKKVKCHQCGEFFRKHSIAFCSYCPARYCERCISSYNCDFFQIVSRSEWKCFTCFQICECFNCKNPQSSLLLDTVSNSLNDNERDDIGNNNNVGQTIVHSLLGNQQINNPFQQQQQPRIIHHQHHINIENLKHHHLINNNNRSFIPLVPGGHLSSSSSSSSSSTSTSPVLLSSTSTTTTTTTTTTSSAPPTPKLGRPRKVQPEGGMVKPPSESKKRPIQLNNDKPKGRPPKNLKEWTSSHKFIINLIEMSRKNTPYRSLHIRTNEPLPPLVKLVLEKREKFGGVLWAKTITHPLLPCVWVKDLTVIPPATKLLPSLCVGKKIVVLFFGDQEEYTGIVGKKSIFSFDEVNQTLLLKCSEGPLKQLELLFNITDPMIASKKDILSFNYNNQINETEEGLNIISKEGDSDLDTSLQNITNNAGQLLQLSQFSHQQQQLNYNINNNKQQSQHQLQLSPPQQPIYHDTNNNNNNITNNLYRQDHSLGSLNALSSINTLINSAMSRETNHNNNNNNNNNNNQLLYNQPTSREKINFPPFYNPSNPKPNNNNNNSSTSSNYNSSVIETITSIGNGNDHHGSPSSSPPSNRQQTN